MQRNTHSPWSAAFGLAALTTLGLVAAPAARAQDVITFDSFPSQPPRNSVYSLSNANNGSPTFDGVTFSANASVLGDQFLYSSNGQPFVKPHSGNYAFAAANAQTTTLTTAKTLYGLYLGQINDANAAVRVTVNALGTGGAVLQSLTDTLTGPTLSFFDTSPFAALTGITGYTFVSQGASGTTNNFDFAADDFTFTPAAAPTLNARYDFDTDSVGTGTSPTSVQTTFSDSSGGIAATFRTTSDPGGFGVQRGNSNFTAFSGNYLYNSSGGGKDNLPLSVAFDHTLQSGSVAFVSNGAGIFTVQELLNGQVVGTVTSTGTLINGLPQGTLSFGGVSFDSLRLSDAAPNFSIDTLLVGTAAPEPSQWTALGLSALGLGGLAFRARRRATL